MPQTEQQIYALCEGAGSIEEQYGAVILTVTLRGRDASIARKWLRTQEKQQKARERRMHRAVDALMKRDPEFKARILASRAKVYELEPLPAPCAA